MRRSRASIRNIVEQLLAISRIGARPDAAFELAYRSNRQIDFITPRAPVAIRGDRLAIQSVISNVIDNALRAEPAGGMIATSAPPRSPITARASRRRTAR